MEFARRLQAQELRLQYMQLLNSGRPATADVPSFVAEHPDLRLDSVLS